MAVSENTGNSTSVTAGGGETTLATITSAGVYQFSIDLNVLANGDVLEVRIYTKVRTGATSRVAWLATYQNAQGADNMNAYSPPLMIHGTAEFKVTVTLTGTTRTFVWSIAQA